ncbi:MAG: hypothetical protein IKO11_04130 [Lachnospiraceae bacterium]|nr:hypothetical protein [Lachnospiraceae bacterium]
MINPVDSRNTYTGAYERGGKKAARIEGEAPAFLLPDDGGVIWERGSSPKQAPKPKAKKEEYRPLQSVREEKTEKKEEQKKAAAAPGQTQGGFFSRIAAFFRDFFSKLWYGDEAGKKEKEENKENAEKTAAAGNAAGGESGGSREQRIRDLIAAKDTEALSKELTGDGKRKPARNTGLLTYYDRFGRIVRPRDSEAARIMKASDQEKGVERRPQGNYRRYI